MASDRYETSGSEGLSDGTHSNNDDDIDMTELMLLARRRGRKRDTSAAYSPIKADDRKKSRSRPSSKEPYDHCELIIFTEVVCWLVAIYGCGFVYFPVKVVRRIHPI